MNGSDRQSVMNLASQVRLSHVPRLSIGFLLLWTTSTAVVLAVMPTFGFPSYPRRVLDFAILIVSASVMGWVLAGALLVLWHAARRTLWPLEPGEWLVLGAAGTLVLRVGEQLTYRLLRWLALGDPFALISVQSISLETVALAGIATVFIAGAIAQRHRIWWSAMLWAIAFATLPEMMPRAMYPFVWTPPWATYLGGMILLLTLATAGIISDWRRGEPRHWLHWSGVILFWLGSALIATILLLVGLGIVPLD
ncbi:MAG: hypothetical protein K8T91_16665 [Planctomycetes bacterium]|nr:hypothetical protein [Planctomycetota bacterium]